EYYEVLFGCWHAGLTAVPMNAKLHAREFAYILENAGARLCVVSPDLQAAVPRGVPASELESDEEAVPAEVRPDDAAWLFYTSGTTGVPKGAVLTHRNLWAQTLVYVADSLRAIDLFGPRLYQLYGQGEAPMTITGLPQEFHSKNFVERLSTCGFARSGVEVKIFDDQEHELPAGEVGEIVTRSDCVMAGYWENPDATAKTLRGGWLHTGDLGSLDAAGFLTIKDRSKDMIISGGSNIYPREIEEVLLRHPAVAECSVVGRPHPEWGEEVVAFI